MKHGRWYLYTFDFPKFRDQETQSIRLSADFVLSGICWKLRYAGEIRISIGNLREFAVLATDRYADSYPLPMSLEIRPNDQITVTVIDLDDRWFRWFRPNAAHVTFEGMEMSESDSVPQPPGEPQSDDDQDDRNR